MLNKRYIEANNNKNKQKQKQKQQGQGQGQRCQNWPSLVSSSTWFLKPIIFTITPRPRS